MSGTSARSDRFVEALRAGEPRAVQAANRLLGNLARKHEPTDLTERQHKVVELMARGWSDGEIALELGIHGDTVREHVGAAKRRLGARSRPHAVVLWLMDAA